MNWQRNAAVASERRRRNRQVHCTWKIRFALCVQLHTCNFIFGLTGESEFDIFFVFGGVETARETRKKRMGDATNESDKSINDDAR